MPFKPVKLNDGRHCPPIAFGSAASPKDDQGCAVQVDQAIDVGFDHIDTAQMYLNEPGVGLGLKESSISRSEIWVTTKWSGSNGKGVKESCHDSLQKLGLEYIDLYLIHNPRICNDQFEERWKEMEELKKEGKVKSIGVSNFTIDQIERILKSGTIPPAVNQILLHPYVIKSTAPLLEYMASKHILPEAYSALSSITRRPGGPVDKPVSAIAEKMGIKDEQVLLAWAKAKGAIIVTTSSKKERLESYLDVGDIDLSEEDIAIIDKYGAKGQQLQERKEMVRRIAPWAALAVAGCYLCWTYLA